MCTQEVSSSIKMTLTADLWKTRYFNKLVWILLAFSHSFGARRKSSTPRAYLELSSIPSLTLALPALGLLILQVSLPCLGTVFSDSASTVSVFYFILTIAFPILAALSSAQFPVSP